RKVLADIARSVGTSEGDSKLTGIVREKIAELQEKHALLENLSDQIIHPDSLARQLNQVELSMLPRALEDRLQEVSQLHEKHKETLEKAREKDDEIFSLKQALCKAEVSLGELNRTREALKDRESQLEQLGINAKSMDLEYRDQIKVLKKEIFTLKASVKERQDVVEEFYDKMVTAEDKRDAAIKQRDTARHTASQQQTTIERLETFIVELDNDKGKLTKEVQNREIQIRRLELKLKETTQFYEDDMQYFTEEINALNKINRADMGKIEKLQEKIAELEELVEPLQNKNNALKLTLQELVHDILGQDENSFKQVAAEEIEYEADFFKEQLKNKVKKIQLDRDQLQTTRDTHLQYLDIAKNMIENQESELALLHKEHYRMKQQLDALKKERLDAMGQTIETTHAASNVIQGLVPPLKLSTPEHQEAINQEDQDCLQRTREIIGISHVEKISLKDKIFSTQDLQFINNRIAEINGNPNRLTSPELFQGFFELVKKVGAIKDTQEFFQLESFKKFRNHLCREGEAEATEAIKMFDQKIEETSAIVLGMLEGSISRYTQRGSMFTRYRDFSQHLAQWICILDNLDPSLYSEDSRLIDCYRDANALREQMRDLYINLYGLMESSISTSRVDDSHGALL
ncbi:MAG: hypothetical protein HRU43_02225, partial [Simkaniaceae bacterium]|nr:hypothetical protein [Simkaniaceae bacterium]